MDKDDIVFGKFVMIVAIVIVIFGVSMSYVENNKTKDMVNSGLEQCPKHPGSYVNKETIWVKSCSEYIDKMKGK